VETQRGVRNAAAQRQAERSAVIRTAMTDHVRHRSEHTGVGRRTIQVDEPSKAAHLQDSLQHFHGGEELQLDRAGDLGAGNGGMLIFVEGRERAEYVPWGDVEQIEFNRPPQMYPPLRGR
jgi:hypothetical protein